MTPHDIIYSLLAHDYDLHYADQLTDEILERVAAEGFVVVHVSSVVQQDGKVSVTRRLVDSVLEDAEAAVTGHYFADGKVIAALQSRYERDMADILALRAEIKEGKE